MVNDSLSNKSKAELLYLLENALKERIKVGQCLEDGFFLGGEHTNRQHSEEYFLLTLINIVEQNLKKPEIEFLSGEFCMSKSTFYRRIKLITGLSPTNFIRIMRMKKAQILLLNRMLNISEVAYSLGFNDPKYFSSCFKKEFGITPSEYQHRFLSSYA